MLISDGNFNGQISASLEVDYNDGYAINGVNDAVINNQLYTKNFEMTPNISAISSFYGLIAIYVNRHILVYDFETFLILKKFESTYFDVEIPDVTRLKFIEFQSDSSLRPIIFIETKTQIFFYILQSNSTESNTPAFSMKIQNTLTDIVNLDRYLFLLIENRLFFIDCNAFSQPSPIQFDSEVHHICSKNSQTLFVLSHGNLFSLHIQEMSKLQEIITQLPPCFDMTAIYKENLVLFSYDKSQPSNLIMTFVNTTSNPPSSKSYKFSDEEFGFDRTKRFFYASSIHHPIFIISVENSSSAFTVQATQIDSVIVLQSEDYQICPPRGIDESRQLLTGLYFVDRKPRNSGNISGYNPIAFWGNYQVFVYNLCGLQFECDPIEASVEVTFSSTQVPQFNDDDTSTQPSTQVPQSNVMSSQPSTQVTQSNDDTSAQPSPKTDDAQSETLDTMVNSQPNRPDVVISVQQQIDDPKKGQEFDDPEVKTFDKPDSFGKQIIFESQENEFDEGENDGSIKDISFYNNIVDISTSLNVLAVYNSEKDNVEIYNLEQVLRNGLNNLQNEPMKTYHISSNDIRNITIISKKTRPLIGLSTTTGIILIDIAQECKEFQRIEIDEGGNDQIQYTDIRRNEIVCLSHNKTLFIYNFITQTHQFLSSYVSCYTISPEGLIFYSCDNRFYQYSDSSSEFLFGLFQHTISINCVLNNLLFIISIREQKDGMNNPYVYTLYDYLHNEKISKYDFSQSDLYDDKLFVVSSPYNSFVIVSNAKRYYTCNSIDSFNKYTLDEDDDIPIIYDDDCDECEVAKMFYLENVSVDLYPTYPCLIGFFGTNFIQVLVIRKKLLDDELPFTITEENPIDALPYATITRYTNSFQEIYDRNLGKSDHISICVSFSSDLICLYSEQEFTIFKYTDYLDDQKQELSKIQLPNIHWANFIEIDPPMLAVHSNEELYLYSIENSTSQQLHQFDLGQFVRSIVNVGNFLFCLIQHEVFEIDCLNKLQKKNEVISTSPIEVIAKRNSNELLYISEQKLFSYNISTSQSSQIETKLLPHCIDMASVNGSKVVLFTTTDEGWSAYQKGILNTNKGNSITKYQPFNQLIAESNERALDNLLMTLAQLTNSINNIKASRMNHILENLRQAVEDNTTIGQLTQTFLLVLCIIDITNPEQISFVKFAVEDIKFTPFKKFIHCESENSPLIIFGESGSSWLFSLDTSIENDNVTLFSFPDDFMFDVFLISESQKQGKDVKIIRNVMLNGNIHFKIEQLQHNSKPNRIKQSISTDKDEKEIENIFQKMQEQIDEIKNKEEQIMKQKSLLYIEQYKNDRDDISFDDFHITSQQLLKEINEFSDEIDEFLSKCEQMGEDDTFLQQIGEDDIVKFEQLYEELSNGINRLRQLLGRNEFQQNI